MISIVAEHGLVIASGHIVPEEALMVLREANRQGVQHLIPRMLSTWSER